MTGIRFTPLCILSVMLLLLAGCGDATAPDAALAFKFDAQTCSGSATVNVYVDGAYAGTETVAVGANSTAYPVTPGSHTLGVTIPNSGLSGQWGPINVQVESGHTAIQVLTCR